MKPISTNSLSCHDYPLLSFSMQDVMTFEMDHQMGVYAASIYFPTINTRHLFDQQLAAPFDTYVLNAFAFVIDTATNQSVPITKFGVADPLINFVTHSVDSPTTNKFTYDAGQGPITIDVESRALELDIRRGVLSRTFTVCMWIVNWALTVGTVYTTLVILVNAQKMSDAVLALPITVILIIPAIRGLYVGAPTFGILLGRHSAPWSSPSFATLIFPNRYGWILFANHPRSVVFFGSAVRHHKTAFTKGSRVGGQLCTSQCHEFYTCEIIMV